VDHLAQFGGVGLPQPGTPSQAAGARVGHACGGAGRLDLEVVAVGGDRRAVDLLAGATRRLVAAGLVAADYLGSV
jgi:hypothetical protein